MSSTIPSASCGEAAEPSPYGFRNSLDAPILRNAFHLQAAAAHTIHNFEGFLSGKTN
jgi:hypothetical protein